MHQELHLVTGGGGYSGFHLGKELARCGHKVKLVDIHAPLWPIPDGVQFIKADLCDLDSILEAMHGVNCVYHMASFGMTGHEQLQRKRIEQVNIIGTENIIKACLQMNVERLVYTSTYNVVFGGQEIHNGDETLPYLPDEKQPDHYSRTKSIAERKILAANLSKTSTGSILRTCALRLAGIYGPGEQRHLPRIVSYLEKRLFVFVYGAKDSLVDFLHIDNLVSAHILAAKGLTAEKNFIASGQAYFISDGKPINNFEFFRPLIEGLGYSFPTLRLPVWLIFYFAALTELIHNLVANIYNFQPFLTCTEVSKTGVTHYFSIMKAEEQLGYTPTKQNDLSEAVKILKESGCLKATKDHKPFTWNSFLVNIILGLIFAAIILSFLPLAA